MLLNKNFEYYTNVRSDLHSDHSQWDNLWLPGKKGISTDCYNENLNKCLDYANCGIAVKGNRNQCIPGDNQGAFFDEHVDRWIYNNTYDKFIFQESQIEMNEPWSKWYNHYEVKYPSPISRATL